MPKLVANGLSQDEFHQVVAQQVIKDPKVQQNFQHENKKSIIKAIQPDKESWISQALWLWVTDLVNIANKTPLQDEHLGSIPPSSNAENILKIFDDQWLIQKGKTNPSLIYALFGTFRYNLWRTGIVEATLKGAQLVVPIIVQLLLKWYASGDGTIGLGVGYCFILLSSTLFFQGIIQCNNIMLLFKTGMDVRTILCARIYEKALTVSSADKAKLTTGEIVNLMSADAEKIVFTCLMFHGLWTTPLFLIGAIWLLVNLVGTAILPGLGMLLITAPIQGYVIATQQKLQRAVLKISDVRVKLVNEVLQGIRVVKYYNWEVSFQQRLADAREKEIVLIKRLAHINALNSALMNTVPMLMLIAMLITFYLMGGDFKPETIFVAVSLLVLIRFPLIMLPMTIASCVMGSISIHRIQRFLLFDDMPRFSLNNQTSRQTFSKKQVNLRKGTIQVSENEFAWAVVEASTESSSSEADKTSPTSLPTTSPSKNGDNGKGLELANLPKSATSSGLEVNGGGMEETSLDGWKLKLDAFQITPGTLLAVTGRVGSGKSSFLAALLGELDIGDDLDKSPLLAGSVGFAPQQPWIMNATLRDNITFGNRFDEKTYREVIDCCCLGPDLATLPAGDRTEIGEKGINLSGGQKARIGLARAVYCDPDIILLDDVLAAVDSHVGKKLFEACILGRLRGRGRTVVLVTNQLSLLSSVDDVIVIDNGVMAEHGTCDNLRKKKDGAFSKMMETYVPEEEEEEEETDANLSALVTTTTTTATTQDNKQAADSNTENNHDGTNQTLRSDDKAGDLIEEESKAVGTVGEKIYLAYLVDSVGGSYFNLISLIVLSIGAQSCTLVFEWWLAYWSDAWAKKDDNGKEFSNSETIFYMVMYIGFGFIAIIMGLFRYLNHARHSARAAEGLFNQLLQGVLFTAVEFFDVTPVGRILNRFAKDTDSIDTILPQNLMSFDFCLMNVLGSLIMSAVMMPPFIIVLIPVLVVYFKTLLRYVPVSRDLQRLESISRSPIFAQFSETLSGTAVIRGFGRTKSFLENNRRQLDEANRPFYFLQNSNRWLQLRLEALGSLIIFSVAMIVVWSRAESDSNLDYGGMGPLLGNSITVGIAGLVLTYTQQITGLMNWAVRMACEVENRMTNVERTVEYSVLEPEEQPEGRRRSRSRSRSFSGSRHRVHSDVDKKKNDIIKNKGWPVNGAIEFRDVNMRYREGLPLVLKNVNLTLPGGSKVGFCGRSGSGKSSILVALFRITNVQGGIYLDDVNIASLRLRELRRAVGIIPQDPVLFVGNLRDNLDAFHEFEDAEIHEALRCACLNTPEVESQHPGGLDATVDEGGSNWSTGQRQLICLARAVLRAPKVLAIDEATANIDLETDAIVQQSIRTKFKDATTITIAHRLQTILDSDLIVTMDDGNVAECDSPANLLSNPTSLFSGLVMNDKGAAAAAGLLKSSSSSSNLLIKPSESEHSLLGLQSQ